jgi:hypothetical protein
MLLKTVAVVVNNPHFSGTIDRHLFEAVFEEDLETDFQDYGDPPNLASNYRSNPNWPCLPNAPSPVRARRGPYLGAPMTAHNFPDHKVPRFGTQEYEDDQKKRRLAAMQPPRGAVPCTWGSETGEACGSQSALASADEASTTSPEETTTKLTNNQRKIIDQDYKRRKCYEANNIDDEYEIDPNFEAFLDRFDDGQPTEDEDDEIRVRSWSTAATPAEDEDEDEPAPPAGELVNQPDSSEPVREIFYDYCVPAELADKTDKEKWQWIRQQRKRETPEYLKIDNAINCALLFKDTVPPFLGRIGGGRGTLLGSRRQCSEMCVTHAAKGFMLSQSILSQLATPTRCGASTLNAIVHVVTL